jgi:hypothetical protein
MIFGFFGFAVAVPWATAVTPVSVAAQRAPERSIHPGQPSFAITATRSNGNMG